MELNERTIKDIDTNEIIKSHIPFIIKSITKITKRYVSIENDEEFSVAILAFNEAINRYTDDRGPFLPFAQLVIISRLKTYLQRENKNRMVQSIDYLKEEGIEVDGILDNPVNSKDILIEEISSLNNNLKGFGFEFEDLIDESPKHKDTRDRAIDLSYKVSKDEELTNFMYTKKRLPIKRISLKYSITEKIIKGSKKFIITVIIIFNKNYRNLILWIKR